MKKDNRPTETQLKELYEAAVVFKQAQPWKWLYDSDVICVENPDDKTIGHCSVMGRGGEHFALGVYFGDEGVNKFWQLMDNADTLPIHQILNYQNCLMCSFEDREELNNDDRKQIKQLGLSFRGRNEWPKFRRFEPGYFPWFLNEKECVFLTVALRQVLIASHDILDGESKIDLEKGETILRVSEDQNGKTKWHSKQFRITIPTLSYDPVIITDDLLMHKIKKAGRSENLSLQADICYLPTPIQEKKDDRPYYPRIFLLINTKSGLPMRCRMYESIHDDVQVSLNDLISFCMEKGIPGEIQIRGKEMKALLDDFCIKAKIRLTVVEHLPAIDQLIEDMVDQM